MKIERYTRVDIGDGCFVWIKNIPYKVYSISEDGKIFRENTQEYVHGQQVTLYKQILDEEGNKLETPLYDEDDCYFIYPDGTKVKCARE